MVELSENARKGLDDYLRQVRSYLRWSKSLDRDEVEQNIAEHIERELEDAPEPVSASVLESVLARLGSPRQWVPPEALNWWGKLILKLHTNSEDWRLAYISFSFLLIGFVLMLLVSPLQVVFFAASFITARAALAAAGAEDLGAQKWLLYPVLLLVSAAFVLTLFLGPALLAGIIGAELHEAQWVRRDSHMGVIAFVYTSTVLATSLWWMLVGLLACKWPSLIRQPLHPFAARFSHRRALAISGVGVLVLALLAGFIALYMNDAFAIFM
jgi:HAAS